MGRLTVAVSQKIVSFELNRDYVPEELEDFFSEDIQQNWVDLVPRMPALPSLLSTSLPACPSLF